MERITVVCLLVCILSGCFVMGDQVLPTSEITDFQNSSASTSSPTKKDTDNFRESTENLSQASKKNLDEENVTESRKLDDENPSVGSNVSYFSTEDSKYAAADSILSKQNDANHNIEKPEGEVIKEEGSETEKSTFGVPVPKIKETSGYTEVSGTADDTERSEINETEEPVDRDSNQTEVGDKSSKQRENGHSEFKMDKTSDKTASVSQKDYHDTGKVEYHPKEEPRNTESSTEFTPSETSALPIERNPQLRSTSKRSLNKTKVAMLNSSKPSTSTHKISEVESSNHSKHSELTTQFKDESNDMNRTTQEIVAALQTSGVNLVYSPTTSPNAHSEGPLVAVVNDSNHSEAATPDSSSNGGTGSSDESYASKAIYAPGSSDINTSNMSSDSNESDSSSLLGAPHFERIQMAKPGVETNSETEKDDGKAKTISRDLDTTHSSREKNLETVPPGTSRPITTSEILPNPLPPLRKDDDEMMLNDSPVMDEPKRYESEAKYTSLAINVTPDSKIADKNVSTALLEEEKTLEKDTTHLPYGKELISQVETQSEKPMIRPVNVEGKSPMEEPSPSTLPPQPLFSQLVTISSHITTVQSTNDVAEPQTSAPKSKSKPVLSTTEEPRPNPKPSTLIVHSESGVHISEDNQTVPTPSVTTIAPISASAIGQKITDGNQSISVYSEPFTAVSTAKIDLGLISEVPHTNQTAVMSSKSSSEKEGNGNVSSATPESVSEGSNVNSTIMGVAVKTSVSASFLLSNNNSKENVDNKIPEGAIDKKIADDGLTEKNKNDSLEVPKNISSATSDSTTSSPITTTKGFGNLKPRLKTGGDSDTPRTRKPFLTRKRPTTTTSGTPISIFGQARTRSGSITSSTTPRAVVRPSTVSIHYASRLPGWPHGGFEISVEPIPTTPAPTTTEETIPEIPFTETTQVPSLSSEDNVTLVRVAGFIVIEKGLKWSEQLTIRQSPEYKTKANSMHRHLERLFRSSSIAQRLWKIEIDGFSKHEKSKSSVAVDFFLYLIKSTEVVEAKRLSSIFHDKLINNTFARYRVDTQETDFETLQEEPLHQPTHEPETPEPPVPQWVIAVVVIGAASLIFIVLFATVTMYGRHHMRRRYSHKLSEEDMERCGDWESKMAATYENLAADTIYDVEDLHNDNVKRSYLMD